jgi:hypothetical protein
LAVPKAREVGKRQFYKRLRTIRDKDPELAGLTILERWRDPDPDVLAPWLLAACDRHTHEAPYDTAKQAYDFGDCRLTRTPIEILMIFRLRELTGLANPTLQHPLMEAPFDVLPEPQPPCALDDVMQGTLKRAGEDWPQLEEVTSLEAVKRLSRDPKLSSLR